MAQPARNFEQPDERAARLFELGLEERTVEEAVIRGLTERRTCTPFHPPSYPGTTQWAETHAAIRHLLAPAGWTPNDSRNYSRVISPNERIAITVATGDSNTGQVAVLEPATKYPKGPATRDAVETNQQLSIFPADNVVVLHAGTAPDPLDVPALQTWIILLHTDDHRLRYELSLPAEQDSEGRVVAWEERITFPEIEIDQLPEHGVDDNEDENEDGGADDIDVPIERI
jgi:hypothetical protein